VGSRDRSGADFVNQLVKLDVTTGATLTWSEPGRYPGEPVFVPSPDGGRTQDAGVVLSVGLDVAARSSFLLVLDAGTFEELARAEVPHAIPFDFHGLYTQDD
jgi:carotenoid cleavage dioxygenase-like enzyme